MDKKLGVYICGGCGIGDSIDTEKLVKGRREAGRPVVELRLPNHSHLSEAYAVGTADESLSAPLLQFIREHGAPRR